jgi:hypothetical protein
MSDILSFNARDFPGVSMLICSAWILYQGVSGRLTGRGFGTWIARKEHPVTYWTILGFYMLIALGGWYAVMRLY